MSELIPFRRDGFFHALLWNADRLEEVCTDYLITAETPNIPGLCVALGTTPQHIRRVFSEIDKKDAGTPLASPDSLQILATTLLKIEDNIVSNGLIGGYNAHMSKFVLSAFHNRNEKIESHNTSDNTIRVVLASHTPVSLEELREYDRLETAIEEQRQLELTALGKAAAAPEAENAYSEDCLI